MFGLPLYQHIDKILLVKLCIAPASSLVYSVILPLKRWIVFILCFFSDDSVIKWKKMKNIWSAILFLVVLIYFSDVTKSPMHDNSLHGNHQHCNITKYSISACFTFQFQFPHIFLVTFPSDTNVDITITDGEEARVIKIITDKIQRIQKTVFLMKTIWYLNIQ
jgi:hypothetical protein